MAIPPSGEKRPRLVAIRPLPYSKERDDREEYERAVSFLREFRSRRLGPAAELSMSLDAILEARPEAKGAGPKGPESESATDALSSNLALTLSLGSGPAPKRKEPLGRCRLGSAPAIGSVPTGLSGMKRAATTQCLLDLDRGGGGDASCSPSSGNESAPSTGVGLDLADDDFYLGCHDAAGPGSKRHRQSFLGLAT